MNILWITNILLPEAIALLTGKGELKGSGGWMIGAANALLTTGDIELSIAAPSGLVKDLKVLKGQDITYYAIPMGRGNHKYNPSFEPYWKRIKELVKPDVVHIHGTEFSHGLAYIRSCGNEKVIVSIQGLTSIIVRYFYSGLRIMDLIKCTTLFDIYTGGLVRQYRELCSRASVEAEYFKSIKYVIGRTSWDLSHTFANNPACKYFKCNETLRDGFYSNTWSIDKCIEHSIFVSQAAYTYKGFHMLLDALPIVLQNYPDTQVRVAGTNIMDMSCMKRKIIVSGYGNYLHKKVVANNLENVIYFLGQLSEENIVLEYLKAHVFVCPSSIENSSNSIGEAQLLGVPVVASYVGGSSDLVEHNVTGLLYRFEETEMLAYSIIRIFQSRQLATALSVNERMCACKRHDPQLNRENLMDIYNQIIGENE